MKIIEPSVELWKQEDPIVHVARCARICYRRETGNNKALIKHLIDNKHLSMFRHESVYAIIPEHRNSGDYISPYLKCPYIQIKTFNRKIYIATNGQFMLELEVGPFKNLLNQYIVSSKEFANTDVGFSMLRYTFRVITQISTSRELNRVSPNNIAEQSTRYVYEDGTICRPHWLKEYEIYKELNGMYCIHKNDKPDDDLNKKVLRYVMQCDCSFKSYKYLVDAGLYRQDARGVLPLDTATVCAYTYSVDEWRRIIDLRYYGTTGKPHPNAKLIAGMIRDELIKLGYKFRD